VEKRKKLKKQNSNLFKSISKQFVESVESVLKKKKKATVGRICRKGGFKPGMKE